MAGIPFAPGTLRRMIPGTPVLSPYLGVVNCRYMQPDTINAGVASSMSTRGDYARDDITSLRVLLPNFYATATGEVISAADRLYRVSIEYPLGTVTQVLFGGSATGTAPAGQPWLASDDLAIAIPRGAFYRYHIRQQSAAGIIIGITTSAYSVLGDQQTIGSNVTDQTMNPGWAGTAGGNGVGAIILAQTARPTLMLIGDSRCQGTGNTSNSVPYPGELMPFLAPYFGCINLGRGSAKAQDIATPANFAARAQLFQYVSHAVLQLGTNDLAGSAVTAAQLTGWRKTIRDYAPTKTWLQTTIMPKVTGSYGDLASQLVDSNNPARLAFCDLVRAGQDGFAGFFDTADAFESSRNSGKLKAPAQVAAAITADGNHLNNEGYALGRPYVQPQLIAGIGI